MVTGPSPVAGHTEMALFAFAPRGVDTRLQPQVTNLYHFHVADTPLDPSISVYSFVFCAQPYLCSRSSLKFKKKKKKKTLSFPSFSLGPLSLHKHFFPKFWSTWFFCLLKKKKKTLFFRAVWDSQQNWAESRVSIYLLPHTGQPLPHHSTIVTVDELTPYYNPKSVVYSRVYALCTFYGFWQMYNGLYPLL